MERIDGCYLKQKLKYIPRRINGIPYYFYFQWHITDSCNLECRHCYNDKITDSELSYNEMEIVINRILSALSLWKVGGSISLTGGEPIISPKFFWLLDQLKAKYLKGWPINVSLMSNGTLITPDFVDKLIPYNFMLRSIQISLDGATEVTNDRIRGTGVFNKALNAIKLLKKRGFLVDLHFVLNKENKNDAVGIVNLGIELGVERITISRMVPIGRADKSKILSPMELREIWSRIYNTGIRLRESRIQNKSSTFIAMGRCDLWHLIEPEIIQKAYKTGKYINIPPYLRIGGRCPLGFNGLTIDCDGTIYGCKRFPIVLGNILEDTIFKIWYTHPLLWEFRHREKKQLGKCQYCPFMKDPSLKDLCCGGAPCLSYAVSGDYFTPDPQCWFNPYNINK